MDSNRSLIFYIIKRSIEGVLLIFGTIIIVFLISHLLSTNPAALWAGPKARPSTIAAVKLRYHLNDPVYVQLWYFLSSYATGNLGIDPVTGQSILSELLFYFPNTLELVLMAFVIIIIAGIGLGYLSAMNFGNKKDSLIRIFYLGAWSTPTFLGAALAISVFASYIPIFPVGGMYSSYLTAPPRITGIFVFDSLITGNIGDFVNGMYHLILPAATLAFLNFGLVTRISRSGVLGVRWMPYVRTAYSKGLPMKEVQRHHILRTGLIEANTVVAVMFGWLISGTVVVEELFSWPGIGRFAYNAVVSDNYPVLIAVVIVFTIAVVVANLVADILYAVLDPRITLSGERS